MKSYLFLALITLLAACNVITKIRIDKNAKEQLKCREQWVYSNLKDTVKIKILLFNAKGRGHLVDFPNFIIGEDISGHIFGYIDNLTSTKYKIGDSLTLCSFDYNDTLSTFPLKRNVTGGLDFIPVLRVSTKSSYNELYCKINKIYYCKIIE